MPTTPPCARPTAKGAFARTTITIVMAVIAALAFVFSFGNVWALTLRLGVPRPIAPLIAPTVDLSVVGLLVALHHLAAHGTDPAHLRSATRLMHLCGLLTVALNTAEPLLARHYGRAALDTVAPALLLGWGAVGPTLLRHLHTPTEPPEEHQTPPPAELLFAQRAPTSGPRKRVSAPARTQNAKPTASGKRTGRPPAATMDQLLAIARPAVAEHGPDRHRGQEGPARSQYTDRQRPLHRTDAADEGRASLGPATTMPGAEPEPARAHPAET